MARRSNRGKTTATGVRAPNSSTGTRPPALPAPRYPARPGRVAPQTPSAIGAALVGAGMDSTAAMGPGRPINPNQGYSQPPRAMDYPVGVNINVRTRAGWGLPSFDTIRALIKSYDVARICINHKIDEIRSMELMFQPARGVRGNVDEAIDVARLVLRKPDRELPYLAWVSKLLENALKFDAAPLYRRRNLDGDVIGLEVLDGTTINPYIDERGRRPLAPAPAYYQIVHGQPWNWYTTEDLSYEMFRPQEDSPFGTAPMESILLTANTDIRFQWHFLQMFTEGSIPGGFVKLPPDVSSPDQVAEWQDYWDAMMAGDQTILHRLVAVPAATEVINTRPEKFDPTFPEYLMMRACAAHGVVPHDVGLIRDVNRSTGETQTDMQFRVNTLPWVLWLEQILSDYLRYDIGLPVQVKLNTGREKEDRLQEAQAWKIGVDQGAVSADEMRSEMYGLPVDKNRPTPRFINNTRLGPIPLLSIEAVAGRTDPEIYGPAADQQPLDRPYAGPIGVIPQAGTADAQASLAAVDAEQQQHRAQLDAQRQASPSNVPTVADPAVATVGKAAGRELEATTELAAFRRYAKTRAARGRWRDFGFTATDPVTAHRLNDSGRLAVRKAAGAVAVAGLAVRARDTGRVLMLQRGLDPTTCPCGMPLAYGMDGGDWWSHADGSISHDIPFADSSVSDLVGGTPPDPAAGTWEFPGGHVEDGESPLAAAVREWSEETGILLAVGDPTGQWAGGNGIYAGFVVEVPGEAFVPVFSGRDSVTNPDDPDGDRTEALAWWDPAQLPGNPAVRPELAADLDAVLPLLTDDIPPAAPEVAKSGAPGDDTTAAVYAQLLDAFPADQLAWALDIGWTGPQYVPLSDVNFDNAEEWQAAHEPGRVRRFRDKIRRGTLHKPVILVRRPGRNVAVIVDGHHRALAYRDLDRPVYAYIGYAHDTTGPWDELHSFQGQGRGGKKKRAKVGKATGPGNARAWPGWDRDLELADHYTNRIRQAVGSALDADQVARRWLNRRIRKAAIDPADPTWIAARDWLINAGYLTALTDALGDPLDGIWAEGYVLGQQAAAGVSTRSTVDWAGWTPGDRDAADLILGRNADGSGLAQLLADAGIRIKSLGAGRIDDLARALALSLDRGDSADTLARDLRDILDDGKWASLVASNEIARAVSAATMQTYAANGVEYADWLSAEDTRVCVICDDNEANGPYRLADFPEIPGHPRCRCAAGAHFGPGPDGEA